MNGAFLVIYDLLFLLIETVDFLKITAARE